MPPFSPPMVRHQSVEAIGQCARSCSAKFWRSLRMFIHILDDDSLLRIFHLSRPALPDDDESDCIQILQGGKWSQPRWYMLSHVCRRWRYLVVSLASHFGPHLVCTYDTPVADMLAHSPPLPIIIDYDDEARPVTIQDVEVILLALQRHRQVRRIQLRMPASNLRKLIVAMDGEFSMLEYLYIKPLADDNGLALPETFKAPHLCHISLRNIACSPGIFRLSQPTHTIQSADDTSQCTRCCGTQIWRSLRIFIHILDDDSLLNLFSYCRPVLIDEDETDDIQILRGGDWSRKQWWYNLVHVCRRWRHLVLSSVSRLDLCLRCTYGTPVAEMLAHSPPLPLVIDFLDIDHWITLEDQDGIFLALQHHDRVRRIRLRMFASPLREFITAVDGEFPILEFLYLGFPSSENMRMILPETLQAPHLRHLALNHFAFPIQSPLLISTTGLVSLSLAVIHPSAYFDPSELLLRISLMPQLKTLWIGFRSPISNLAVERQLLGTPVMTHAILPNLRWFTFSGASAYLEALVPWMTTPSLEKLDLTFKQFTDRDSFQNVRQFTSSNMNLRFSVAKVVFATEAVFVNTHPPEGPVHRELFVQATCGWLPGQLSFMAQVLSALGPNFSAVEHVVLMDEHGLSSGGHNGIDPTPWHAILRPFSHANILQVELNQKLARELSRSLKSSDEESHMELLPKLKELRYALGRVPRDTFKGFIDSRQKAGHPITLVSC